MGELHIPLDPEGAGAVSVSLHKRWFVPRLSLLNVIPADESISDVGAASLAAWIARSYTRVALPDALVSRVKPILNSVARILKKTCSQGVQFADVVREIYVRWLPDTELSDNDEYDFVLYFLCDDERIEHELNGHLKGIRPEMGVKFEFEVVPRDEVRLTDIDGFRRFSEWDYFTAPDEVISLIDGEDRSG